MAKADPAQSGAEKTPDVTVGGEIMDPEGCAIRACFDPGLFVKRRHDGDWSEPLHRWQARAVVAALDIAGHLTPREDARPTPERLYD